MELREQIPRLFTGHIRESLEKLELDYQDLQEIRLRSARPLMLLYKHQERIIKNCRVSAVDLRHTLEVICGYSAYAWERELKNGFLSVPGGHRVGVVGKAVMEQGRIKNLKDISGMNLRISHEIPECILPWKSWFYENGNPLHSLLIAPPGCGKTTFLRELIRLYSNGTREIAGMNVGVVDERSELAGTYQGVPTHDLGLRTDLLDACPKAEGMCLLLRSMSPKVLAVDEIGTEEDLLAVKEAVRSGCKVIATVHGNSLEELLRKPGFRWLMEEQVFERYVIFRQGQTPGIIHEIYNRQRKILWEEAVCTSRELVSCW